ncbi:uncharacterized protein LOC123037397 [Drosophila rhopaloa]|uniref:Uncharacterized protein n=1 Tax=Drosophila rhopaloa TaxID=1041015 RepID=A0ABM5J4D6_DRORH|nr:uncharacterized protein LOC123037397 [Drosophila rhopaloa]
MDENGEFILNCDCLLEIMNYIKSDCELKDQCDKKSKYNDLINFVLAHELFLELLETCFKSLYEDLDLVLTCRITKLLIDLQVNELSNRNYDFWVSFLQSIREKNPFFVTLKFEENHACVFIDKRSNPNSRVIEKVKLNANVTAEALANICTLMPNLFYLDFKGTEIHGSLSDIKLHCENLNYLRIQLNPGGGAAQYASVVLLPNLQKFVISGVQESESPLIFFNDLRKLHRPRSLPPLTLTIEDGLSDKTRTINKHTFK